AFAGGKADARAVSVARCVSNETSRSHPAHGNHGCLFVREGAKQTVYSNPANGQSSTVPRHREIKKHLARKICDDLGIPRLLNQFSFTIITIVSTWAEFSK